MSSTELNPFYRLGTLALTTFEMCLLQTVTWMYENRRFKRLVFFVNGCQTGSMFEGILSDAIGVYAVTASNSTASSHYCCTDPESGIDLSSQFSNAWLRGEHY